MSYKRKQNSSNYLNRRYMNEECVLSSATEIFAGRWTIQILYCIHFNLNRFGLIKTQLPRISDHILGLRLKHLVENKLIAKREKDGNTFYSLTEKGRSLIPILEQLTNWHSK